MSLVNEDNINSTTYSIHWAWGKHVTLNFNAATDVLDFSWMQTSYFTVEEVNGSVVISILNNDQSYTLAGVRLADLTSANIKALDSNTKVFWDNLLADTQIDDTPSQPEDQDTTPGEEQEEDNTTTPEQPELDEPVVTEPEPAPAPQPQPQTDPVVTKISWWQNGEEIHLNFNVATDSLDFGWMADSYFTIGETGEGDVVITINADGHKYILDGVSLSDLSSANINALHDTANEYWNSLINGEADPVVIEEPEAPAAPTPEPQPQPDPEPQPQPEPETGNETEEPVEEETPDPIVTPEPEPEENNGSEQEQQPDNDNNQSSSHNSPVVAAYYAEWATYGRDYHISDIPAGDLTHIYYAFSDIENGEMGVFDKYAALEKHFSAADSVNGIADSWDTPAEGQIYGNFNQLALLKEANPDLVVSISVGGWTLSGPFSDMAATAEGREKFAASAKSFLQEYQMFDGIDIDWEYPGGSPITAGMPTDGENYALLLGEVRASLDELESETGREYELSVAAPAGPNYIANFNAAGLAEHLDYFNLMTYDFRGAWGQNPLTGHQANLYDYNNDNLSIEDAVQSYLDAGISADQLVLGNPIYGRSWAGVTPDASGNILNVVSSGAAEGSYEIGNHDYKDLVAQVKEQGSASKIYWDDNAQSAFIYNQQTDIFSTFETPATIALKSEWAQEMGLAGTMFWELSGDMQDNESLVAAAYDSWVDGKSFEEIAANSELQPDFVIGGNGLLDSIVDWA